MGIQKTICFGEVLWDMLPTAKMPGGAPMNVAFHLQSLGLDATPISRIGTDGLGDEILSFMHDAGLNTSLVQRDTNHMTGVVKVNMDDKNEVTYEIVQPAAWDFIQLHNAAIQAVEQSDCFVFGSLAARNPDTRKTLYQLVKAAPFKVFDVNLREPHYTKEVVEHLLHEADMVKMNEHELIHINAWHNGLTDNEAAIRSIAARYSIPTVCVTRGGSGAILMKEEDFYKSQGFEVTVEDTIGSGDSFLAALIKGILSGDPPAQSLELACAVGSLVATYRGATPRIHADEIQKLLKDGSRTS
jgi:fructokinase